MCRICECDWVCDTLQHTALHCITLHHIATHCNAPQSHRNIPRDLARTQSSGAFANTTALTNEPAFAGFTSGSLVLRVFNPPPPPPPTLALTCKATFDDKLRVFVCPLPVGHDSFIWDMTHLYETWLTHLFVSGGLCMSSTSEGHVSLIRDMTRSYKIWHACMIRDSHVREWFVQELRMSSTSGTCLIDMRHDSVVRNMTHFYETWPTHARLWVFWVFFCLLPFIYKYIYI